MGLAGGGKRARGSASMTSSDKVLLLNTALDLLIARLPTMDNKIFNDTVQELLKLKATMETKSDDFIKTTVKTMNAVEITILLEEVKKMQLTERFCTKLAKHFIKEISDMVNFVNSLMQVVECMEAIFMIRLVKSYWSDARGGEIACGALRSDIEERFKVIQIIEAYTSTMSVG